MRAQSQSAEPLPLRANRVSLSGAAAQSRQLSEDGSRLKAEYLLSDSNLQYAIQGICEEDEAFLQTAHCPMSSA